MHTYIPINQEHQKFLDETKSKYPDCNQKGVYELYYFDGLIPKKINRFDGIDDKGILYIGMTEGKLLNRVSNLQKAIMANCKSNQLEPVIIGHKQLSKKFFRIRKKIDVKNLYVSIFQNNNPKNEESIRLENYVIKYGELPPLNGQYGSVSPDWRTF